MQLKVQLRLCQSCLWFCQTGVLRLSQSAVHSATVNYYDLLGVKPNASIEEIKNAFFDKSKRMHPDSDPSNPGLHSQFVELSEAYRVLSKELSRKEYDLRLQQPYAGGQAFRTTSRYSHSPGAQAQDNMRYWEQFRHSQHRETTEEERERTRKKNFRILAYCLITMVASIGAHVVFFRKLEEIHTNFMDEKDRAILKIYNDSKEAARVNGFKKQTEILRQKHAEFLQKYKHGHENSKDK